MLEAPPLPSLLYIYVCGSLRFSTYMYVVCLKGKERPLGELKATYCSESAAVQQNNRHSHCILLALCVCALGRGLPEKVLGLRQRRGPPPPLQPPKLSNTPQGHTLATGRPRALPPFFLHETRQPKQKGPRWP